MKEKRNCNSNNYPIYQQPMMVPHMGYPMGINGIQNMGIMPNMYQGGITTNTIEQQLNNLEQQINLLEQRVTRLERMNSNSNNSNNYNDSNYYMV